jgi:hypothetical protein
MREDALTVALRNIIASNISTINSALATLATAGTYTTSTVSTSDIYIGDRARPNEGGITLCVLSGPTTYSLEDTALGYWRAEAQRTIRGYVDLFENDETNSREEERECVRDTVRSAIVDILLSNTYQSIVDGAGYTWYECRPGATDVGEVRKDKKVFWAFEIEWYCTTQGIR